MGAILTAVQQCSVFWCWVYNLISVRGVAAPPELSHASRRAGCAQTNSRVYTELGVDGESTDTSIGSYLMGRQASPEICHNPLAFGSSVSGSIPRTNSC